MWRDSRQRDGSYRVAAKGRNLELSAYDGPGGRTIRVALELDDDRAATDAAFRRAGRDLRYP